MTPSDIDVFYNRYKNSIGEINRAEQKLLKEAYSYEKWFRQLREKSALIRDVYLKNNELYRKVIKPVCDNPELLTRELAEKFIFHIDYFLTEGYRDYGVTVPVLDVLIPFFEKTEDREHLFDALFFRGLAVMQHNHYEESEDYFNQALSLYADISECEALYRKYRIMCAHFFRYLSLVDGEIPEETTIFKYHDSAVKNWCGDTARKLLSEKKFAGIRETLSSIAASVVCSRLNMGLSISDRLFSIIEQAYECYCMEDEYQTPSAIFLAYYKYKYLKGELSRPEYKEKLISRFEAEKHQLDGRFDYNFLDFISLYDDELPDGLYDKNRLMAVNPSFTYVHFLLTELLTCCDEDEALAEQIIGLIYNYYSGYNYISGFNEVDLAIWRMLKRVFSCCKNTERLTAFVRNIYVHRQIPTAIHSAMVGRLCEVMAGHIYDADSSFFGDEIADRNSIMQHANEAGFFHDIGKLICSDVINLQSRFITDEEFGIIKGHPAYGAELLEMNKYTAKYAEYALGHHRFSNGGGGYPAVFENSSAVHRRMIDLVSICDSVDAATDHLGRNYANAKDLPTVIEELKAGAGTRYNAEIVDFIVKDQNLQHALNVIITEERARIQYELYSDYIMPEVQFTKEDERFVRPMTEDDFYTIRDLIGCDIDTEPENLKNCSINYVTADSRGNIYSYLMAERKKSAMFIHLLYTPDKYRRSGYASMLLHSVEKIAAEGRMSHIYTRKLAGSQNDKFGWRRGFIPSRRYSEYMVLKIRRKPVLFITSSQTTPKNSWDFFGPCKLNQDNYFCTLLGDYWPEEAKVLALASDPDDPRMLADFIERMTEAFEEAGFAIAGHKIDAGDWSLMDKGPDSFKEYDCILLSGGHVPTQNRFFKEIGLKEKLIGYSGIIIGTSAGSMNMAEEVYSLPENPGEATDSEYRRFMSGLGLTDVRILPHYDYLKSITVDGLNPIDEIAMPDSRGNEFIVLADGSFVLQTENTRRAYGKVYLMKDCEMKALYGEF